jgi:two-component system, cell cycle response regulator DivK
MNRRTVLVVDHREEERELLCHYLEFVGAHVLFATTGDEGARAATTHRPDLILLDLSLPGVDRLETIRRLKTSPETAAIPVIALSRHPVDGEELSTAGFCASIDHPFVPYRVLEEVERCIGRLDDPVPGSEMDEALPAEATTPSPLEALPVLRPGRGVLGPPGGVRT